MNSSLAGLEAAQGTPYSLNWVVGGVSENLVQPHDGLAYNRVRLRRKEDEGKECFAFRVHSYGLSRSAPIGFYKNDKRGTTNEKRVFVISSAGSFGPSDR